jgi:hypothetical protein
MEKQIADHALVCNVTVNQNKKKPPVVASTPTNQSGYLADFYDATPNPAANEGGGEAILLETIAQFKEAHPTEGFERFLQSMWPDDYQVYVRSKDGHGSSKRSYKTWAVAFDNYQPGLAIRVLGTSQQASQSFNAAQKEYSEGQLELAAAEEEERSAAMKVLGMHGEVILPRKEDRQFYKQEFEKLYREHDPDKLAGVDFILDGYEGQLDELLQLAKQSYGCDDSLVGGKENMQPGNQHNYHQCSSRGQQLGGRAPGLGGVDSTTLNAVASSIDQIDKMDRQYFNEQLDDDDDADADTLLMQIGNLSAQIAQLKHQIRESTQSELESIA